MHLLDIFPISNRSSDRKVVWVDYENLVDPASSHMLVLRIKPCMRQYESI